MPEEKTLNDLFKHIKEHESEIYVRLKIDQAGYEHGKTELKEEGFHVPEYVFKSLEEEIDNEC